MHRRARLDTATRRAQLLEIAGELVARQGLAAVSMERVAAEAAVGKPIVYRHFANRSELLVALVHREWDYMDRALQDQQRAQKPGQPEGNLRSLVRTLLGVLRERGAALHQLLTATALDPRVESERRRRQRALRERWTAALVELGVPELHARAAAAALHGALLGALTHWQDDGADDAVVEDAFCYVFLGGVGYVRSRMGCNSEESNGVT